MWDFFNRLWGTVDKVEPVGEAVTPEIPPTTLRAVDSIAVYDEELNLEHRVPISPANSTNQNGIQPRSPTQHYSTELPAASRMGRPAPMHVRTELRAPEPEPEPQPEPEPEPDTSSIEIFEGKGKITVLEEAMPRGVISGTYFFDKNALGQDFKRGDIVNFRAEKHKESSQWEVTLMKPYVSAEEEEKQSLRRFNTAVGIVIEIQEDVVKFQFGTKFDEIQDIPIPCLPTRYRVQKGDYLRIKFEIDSLENGCSTGKILSVEPSKAKTLIGGVTCNHRGVMSIDNHIYFDKSVCPPRNLHARDVVLVEAVESDRDDFRWRAISVTKSNFLSYTASQNQADGWLDNVNVWTAPLTALLDDKFGIKVRPRKIIDFGAFRIGSTIDKVVDVENPSERQVTLKSVTVKGDQSVCKFKVVMEKRESDDVITILEPGGSYHFKIQCTPIMLGSTRELCVLDFGSFRIGRHLVITCLSDQEDILNGIRPTNDGKNIHKWQDVRSNETIDKVIQSVNRRVAPGAQLVRSAFFLPRRIPPYPVPKFLWDIVKKEDESQLLHAYPTLKNPTAFGNYSEKFKAALWLEEMDNEILRRQFDMDHVLLRRTGECFAFECPGIKDFHPPIQQGDPLYVFDNADPEGDKQSGYISEIHGTEIYAKFGENFQQRYDNTYVTVQFCMGRTTYKRAHFAVELAQKYLGEDWLFPTENIELKPPRIPFMEDEDDECDTTESPADADPNTGTTTLSGKLIKKRYNPSSSNNPPKTILGGRTDKRSSSIHTFVSDTAGPSAAALSGSLKLKWFNKKLNAEQKDAVRRILRGQGRPLPYIIFGPPGTGKTVTVVEAVLQIYTLDCNSRILVTAPSNSAADIIAQHLVASQLFLPGEFVRLVGFLRQDFQIPENIRDYCRDGDHLDSVARNRVIITTCTTAGQFYSLGLDSGHFTHVFIDEAGYCTEPEAIIAATLVAVSKAGQVILAGDPQQLGPVLMSQTAANCGLSLSFLERLMGLPLYSRNEERFPKEKYNPVTLTKLVKNYRAHPTLLKLPSMLFYDDELESAADEEEINLCHSLNFLPCSGVPLLFHGLQGKTLRDPDSPSWFNPAEVIQVVEYVRKLRKLNLGNDDIGIITPYRKQVEKIRKALELGLLQDEVPKVGSVEEFQGGERKVMIMSLVRSAPEDKMDKLVDRMSFVYSSKRFNVGITRAKSAFIVIGDPHLLAHDENWVKFLQYCIELGCYTGCNMPIKLDTVAQGYLTNLGPHRAPVTKFNSDSDSSEEDQE